MVDTDRYDDVLNNFSKEDWELLGHRPEVRFLCGPVYCFHNPFSYIPNNRDVYFSVRDIGGQEDVCREPLVKFLNEPLENMPLYINDEALWKKVIAIWRMQVAK